MKRLFTLLTLLCVSVVCATPSMAQQQRRSPHETISRKIDNNRITIVYGRPYTKDPRTGEMRKVWGSSLVPTGKIWRLGADEATLLITQQTIKVGETTVPGGAYTLFFLLGEDGSGQLLINKQIGQWGIDPYSPASELARVPMKKSTLPEAVDQLTIAIDGGAGSGGTLKLMWDKTQYSVPVEVVTARAAKS